MREWKEGDFIREDEMLSLTMKLSAVFLITIAMVILIAHQTPAYPCSPASGFDIVEGL